MTRHNQRVLAGLFLAVALLTAFVLSAVLQVIVFAITVGYVLYPLRVRLHEGGVSRLLASFITTLVAFLVVLTIVIPILFVVYQRRWVLIEKLQTIPESITIPVAGFDRAIETEPIIDLFEAWLIDLGVGLAVAAPRIALELALFAIVLFGLLYRPKEIRAAVYGIVPPAYHDVVERLHDQTKRTLYSIYVIQLATATATFGIALTVFLLLGYDAPFSLALIAAILQFIPIVGPSLLIITLIANDVLLGMTERAMAMAVLGVLFISLFPDAVIRPRLASRTGQISAVLYFVGFVGGILTLGAIGLVVGPLVVALLVEVIRIVAERGFAEDDVVTEPARKDQEGIAADGGPSEASSSAGGTDPSDD